MQLFPMLEKPRPALTYGSSILIIGAGTWGISTALHLARRGYNNITVLDPYPTPSPISAGNDVNKILELSSSAPRGSAERTVSDKLARDAINGWREDPVFHGLFHETGAVCAATSQEGRIALDEGDGYSEKNGWTRLESKEGFQRTMPEGVLTGDFSGWMGWWRRDGCGWVEARNAMVRAAEEARKHGVRFVSGERGKVESLIYEDGDVRGAVATYGEPHRADHIILCAGAGAARIFDMKDQLRPTAWTLAHIRMSEEEAQSYKDLPVLFNIEKGFFMEPDAENHELKICDEHPGYCNWETNPTDAKRTSIPFAYHQIPKQAEERVRSFLQDTMPHLANRPFSFARICWCADTPDRAFLISRHPRYSSLVLGVGGSGHGFSYIPAIGGVVADCLEDKMDPYMQHRFRWRPETAVNRDWTARQDRFGPPGSNRVMDLHDVKEWTAIQPERH
jgi:sarcosine oxidase/L-pipecolate oxidase